MGRGTPNIQLSKRNGQWKFNELHPDSRTLRLFLLEELTFVLNFIAAVSTQDSAQSFLLCKWWIVFSRRAEDSSGPGCMDPKRTGSYTLSLQTGEAE